MSVQNIRSALVKGFMDPAFFAQDVIQFENKSFTPPDEGSWAALWFLPNQPTVATLGPIGTDEVTGIFQVDLNFPQDEGDGDAGDKYDEVRNVFKVGSRFLYSDAEVIIKSCGRSQGKVVDSFFRVVVSIAFYAHINR